MILNRNPKPSWKKAFEIKIKILRQKGFQSKEIVACEDVFVVMRCSTKQRSGADRLLSPDEPSRWVRLATDVRYDYLQRQERRRTKYHRHQLCAQVGGTGALQV